MVSRFRMHNVRIFCEFSIFFDRDQITSHYYTCSLHDWVHNVYPNPVAKILATVCLIEMSYLWRIEINKLTSLTPKTNNTWRKLRVSAFQRLEGLGVGCGQNLINEKFIRAQRLKCHLPYYSPLICQRILNLNF